MIRIALDVDDAGRSVLRAIAQSVHHDSTGDRAVRARVARFGRTQKFELADFGDRPRRRETHEREAGAGKRGARYLQELAPGEVSHANPFVSRATVAEFMPLAALPTRHVAACGTAFQQDC